MERIRRIAQERQKIRRPARRQPVANHVINARLDRDNGVPARFEWLDHPLHVSPMPNVIGCPALDHAVRQHPAINFAELNYLDNGFQCFAAGHPQVIPEQQRWRCRPERFGDAIEQAMFGVSADNRRRPRIAANLDRGLQRAAKPDEVVPLDLRRFPRPIRLADARFPNRQHPLAQLYGLSHESRVLTDFHFVLSFDRR